MSKRRSSRSKRKNTKRTKRAKKANRAKSEHRIPTSTLDEIGRLQAEVQELLPEIHAARTKYFGAKTPENKKELKRVDALVTAKWKRATALLARIEKRVPATILAELNKLDAVGGDADDKTGRESLIESRVDVSGFLENWSQASLEKLRGLVPVAIRNEAESWRSDIGKLARSEICLSIVKGVRPESESPTCHRLAQMLRVTEDYLSGSDNYDQFAGATCIPQLTQLGRQLEFLNEVGGEVSERVESLWKKPSAQCDAIIFEILVAAGCAEMGRRIEFLAATDKKSPDLRCHDPYPMVIECKRKSALSQYEIEEEKGMRVLFSNLRARALKLGLMGRFDLSLNTALTNSAIDEIAARLVGQRLAPHPDKKTEEKWGSLAFHELPRRIDLERPTRLYSPEMLKIAFDWDTDLPKWDGLICAVENDGATVVQSVKDPIGLVWSNTSAEAIRRRSWGPVDLVGKAMTQIPPGEFGVLYVAYLEGARSEIADRRTSEYIKRISDWEHSADIRVPISFLVRLYPRVLGAGNPDLIESTIRLLSAAYGEKALFKQFPGTVFTSPHSEK